MSKQEKNLDKHASAYFKLLEISQIIEYRVKTVLHKYEITHGQYNILRILKSAKGEPLRANTIKNRMIMKFPDVTRLVDRLVKKGLVNKEKNPSNRREVNITLLPKGDTLLKKLDPIMEQASFYFFIDQIKETEAVNFDHILTKILTDIRAEGIFFSPTNTTTYYLNKND